MPVVNLYVPIVLDFAETIKIGQWFRMNVDKWVLIEFHQEPSTFGGCAYAWNGMYHDYSFHHYVRNHIADIRNIVNKFADETNGMKQESVQV